MAPTVLVLLNIVPLRVKVDLAELAAQAIAINLLAVSKVLKPNALLLWQ
jgi:hypothetical protein